jgi:hypothetical protein
VTVAPLELVDDDALVLDELALVLELALVDEELELDDPVGQSRGYVLLGSAPPGGGTQS